MEKLSLRFQIIENEMFVENCNGLTKVLSLKMKIDSMGEKKRRKDAVKLRN
jgi:hypothetical protein